MQTLQQKPGFVVDLNSIGNSIIIISGTREKADPRSIKMLKPKWKVEIDEALSIIMHMATQ